MSEGEDEDQVRSLSRWASQQGLRVAVLDRDRAFVRELSAHAHGLGWTLLPQRAPSTARVLHMEAVEAIVLDVGVLGSGWIRWIEQQTPQMPDVAVVVCTGPARLEQRVRGLLAGADDWITKPCSVEELISRVAAIARVRQPALSMNPIHCAGLEVRPDLYEAYVGGRPTQLTRREFDVLHCLARRRNVAVGRGQIYLEVWGGPVPDGDRALDSTIRKLRAKLRRLAPERRYIHTERSVGYRLAGEPASRRR